MRPNLFRRTSVRAVVLFTVWGAAAEARAGTPLTTLRVASGLIKPLYLTHAPGDYRRLFVVEQDGRIRIVKDGVLLETSFLDIDSIVNSGTLEWGLLGLAFHPNYASNGFFYVNYSDAAGDNIIARFQVTANPDVANPSSRSVVLFIDQFEFNHRGGWLEFGVDGFLYSSQGDGGPQNDTNNRGQNINDLRGKMLRIDVDGLDNIPGNADDDEFPADPNRNYRNPPDNPFVGVAGLDEIWAYGLRNPWRCSFDRLTHDLWIADVGQNQREEINYQAAGFAGGANYGWRCMEGTLCTGFTGCTCFDPSLTLPIYEYDHSVGLSITGGYVYRGCAIPDLRGTYFFADYQFGRLFSLKYNGMTVTDFTDRTIELDPPGADTIRFPASFGEDAYGEIFVVDFSSTNTGEVFKIVPAVFGGPDCNSNGVRDECDIAGGTSLDVDASTVPDECECITCAGDLSGNNRIDGDDIARFVRCIQGGSPAAVGCRCADMNASNAFEPADLDAFVESILGALDPNPECP